MTAPNASSQAAPAGGAYQPPAQPRTAADWAAVAKLDEGARKLAAAVPDAAGAPRALLGALLDQGLYEDATRLLAHLLPKREAVWWAWWCAKAAAGVAAPSPAEAEALAACERWVAQPTDEHRRAAMAAAEKAEFTTTAGLIGLATFLSAGSVAPPEAPFTPPPEFVAAKAVAGAVILATVPSGGSPEWHRAFLDQGVRVGQGLGLWPA